MPHKLRQKYINHKTYTLIVNSCTVLSLFSDSNPCSKISPDLRLFAGINDIGGAVKEHVYTCSINGLDIVGDHCCESEEYPRSYEHLFT